MNKLDAVLLSVVGTGALFGHFVGDFIVQSIYKNGWMGREKYRSLRALSFHVITYGIVLFYFTLFSSFMFVGFSQLIAVLIFVLLNTVLHFCIDFFTSKMTNKYVSVVSSSEGFIPIKNENFVPWLLVIGCDQFLHMSIMFASLLLLVGGI